MSNVAPEPVKSFGVPPETPSRTRNIERAIVLLGKVQRGSVVPFSVFLAVHLSSVVVAPALGGVQIGNDMVMLGRELYQTPAVEWLMFGSVAVHVLSGMALTVLRRCLCYVKYGTWTRPGHSRDHRRRSSHGSSPHSKSGDAVKDINEGLGGFASLLGLGSRQSLVSRWFGLSPLSFSGYLLLVLAAGHVYYERVEPAGRFDVDLGFVHDAMAQKGPGVAVSLLVLVLAGSYHVFAGWNRILGLYARRHRLRSYFFIASLSFLASISLWKISAMD